MSIAQQIHDILSELVVEFQRYEGRVVQPWEAVAPDSPEWEIDDDAWRHALEGAPQWVRDLPVQQHDEPWAYIFDLENDIPV
jgi:hypothetical protein